MDTTIKLNIKALAGQMKVSIEKLAEMANIDVNHLRAVSNGRATMTGTDLIRLSIATGISPFNIETEY